LTEAPAPKVACSATSRFSPRPFAIFVKIWFAQAPSLPEDARQTARANSEVRYRKWLEHVVEQFTGGHRLVDDLPAEPIADPPELAAIASDMPPKGGMA
jgi:hypothetical protein